MFAEPRSGELSCSKEELDDHVRSTYSDPKRDDPIPHIEDLKRPSPPGVPFNMKRITLKEVNEFVRKAIVKSEPGRDGISYKALKVRLKYSICQIYNR